MRRWCRRWAQLTDAELTEIVTATKTSNKRWSADQSATVLEITARDRSDHGFRSIGACDDDGGHKRAEHRRQKEREGKRLKRREVRAAKPPPLSQTMPWAQEGISRAQWYRRQAKSDETKSVRDLNRHRTADGICLTKPASAGTTSHKTSVMGRVDAAGVVGNPDADRQRKTRFPTAMQLSQKMKAFATEAGYEPEQIARMFETFRSWNLAKGSYSADWTEVWFNWVDRQVTIETEDYHRRRARAWFEQRAARPS